MNIPFKHTNNIYPSPVEKIIIGILRRNKIGYYREVSFDGLVNDKTNNPLRYDFYIPSKNLLVEYDGKSYHSDQDVKYRDGIKDKFAHDNLFKLVRISGIRNIEKFFLNEFGLIVTNIELPKRNTKGEGRKLNIDNLRHLQLIDKDLWFCALMEIRLKDGRFFHVLKGEYPILIKMKKVRQLEENKKIILDSI